MKLHYRREKNTEGHCEGLINEDGLWPCAAPLHGERLLHTGGFNKSNEYTMFKKKKRQITGTIYLHHNASGIGLFTLQGFLLSNKEILICLFAAGALCAHSETDGVVSEAPARLEGQTSVQLWDWQGRKVQLGYCNTHSHTHKQS